MELTAAQIAFIRQDIQQKGITMNDLSDSLLDHLCCAIENDTGTDFYEAYSKALHAFGNEGLKKIQQQTILLTILKTEVTMKKTMYVMGYIAVCLISTGLLFKVQQWTGAAIMLTLGIALLNLAFLPMYFYQRYKK